MRKILIIALIIMTLSVLLLAQQPAKAAKGHNPEMQMKHEMQPPEIMKELNLSKEQKVKIDALKDTHVKYLNTKKAELQNLQIDKQNAMKAGDYTRVKQINKQISDLQLDMSNKKVDHHQAILKELNAEQKEKFQQMGMHRKGAGQGMMGKEGRPMKGMHGDKKGPCAEKAGDDCANCDKHK